MMDKRPVVYSGTSAADLHIQDAGQLATLALWNRLRHAADIPQRSAFDPLDLHKLLPSVFLAEARGEDWFYRVVGSEIRKHVGAELTGKLVSACNDIINVERILADFGRVATDRLPYRHMFGQTLPGKPWLIYDRLLLPFGSADEVTHILGVTHFDGGRADPSLFEVPLDPPPIRNPK